MDKENLIKLLDSLVRQPSECEWVEFKHNFHSPEEIGENISAISNSACLKNKPYGYIIFGVEDKTHSIVGTNFKAKTQTKGNEDLESWLSTRLNPRIDFSVYEFDYDSERHISIYIIPATKNRPVEFINIPYVRVGTVTRKLGEYPDKESKIWRKDTIEEGLIKEDNPESKSRKYASYIPYWA